MTDDFFFCSHCGQAIRIGFVCVPCMEQYAADRAWDRYVSECLTPQDLGEPAPEEGR